MAQSLDDLLIVYQNQYRDSTIESGLLTDEQINFLMQIYEGDNHNRQDLRAEAGQRIIEQGGFSFKRYKVLKSEFKNETDSERKNELAHLIVEMDLNNSYRSDIGIPIYTNPLLIDAVLKQFLTISRSLPLEALTNIRILAKQHNEEKVPAVTKLIYKHHVEQNDHLSAARNALELEDYPAASDHYFKSGLRYFGEALGHLYNRLASEKLKGFSEKGHAAFVSSRFKNLVRHFRGVDHHHDPLLYARSSILEKEMEVARRVFAKINYKVLRSLEQEHKPEAQRTFIPRLVETYILLGLERIDNGGCVFRHRGDLSNVPESDRLDPLEIARLYNKYGHSYERGVYLFSASEESLVRMRAGDELLPLAVSVSLETENYSLALQLAENSGDRGLYYRVKEVVKISRPIDSVEIILPIAEAKVS